MTRSIKKSLLFFIACITAVVAFLLVIPRFVDLDDYREELIRIAESSTGKQVHAGRLGINFWSGLHIYADNVSLQGEGVGSKEIFQAKKITTRVELLPLLRRKLSLTSVRIDSPEVGSMKDFLAFLVFMLGDDAIMQESVGRSPQNVLADALKNKHAVPFSFDMAGLRKTTVKDGRIVLNRRSASGADISYIIDGISMEAERGETPDAILISAEASLGKNAGSLDFNGILGRFDRKHGIPVDLKGRLIAENIAPISDFIFGSSGMSMSAGQLDLDFTVRGAIGDKTRMQGTGTFRNAIMKAFGQSGGTSKSLNGNVSFDAAMESGVLHLRDATFRTGKAAVSLEGSIDLKEQNPVFHIRLKKLQLSKELKNSMEPFHAEYLLSGRQVLLQAAGAR